MRRKTAEDKMKTKSSVEVMRKMKSSVEGILRRKTVEAMMKTKSSVEAMMRMKAL